MPRHDPIRTTREQRRFTYGPQTDRAYIQSAIAGTPGLIGAPFLPLVGGTISPGPLIIDAGTRTGTGPGVGVFAVWVAADYQSYAAGSANFMDGLAIRASAGGAGTTGNIAGLDVHATLTSPTSPANAGRNYQGIFSWGEALSGDGGTGLTLATAKGGIFGGGSIGYLHSGATNLLNVTGWEFDVCAAAGSSVWLKTGIQIGGVPVGGVADTVHGTWEALIDLFGTGSGSAGFNHGILLNDLHGGPPLTPTGKLVGTDGAAHTIGAGIDFGNYTITGNVLSWLNGSLGGNGNMNLAGTLTTGTGVGTGDAAIELGGGRSGSGTAYIDFHAVSGTDFETRLIRNAGANGTVQLANTGTGSILLQTNAAVVATFAGSGALTIAGGLSVGNNANPAVALFGGTFTQVASPDTASGAATGTILVGGSGNPDNHYRNDTHNFHNRAASVAYAAMTATGTTIGNPAGGAKGAGTINAVQVYGAGVLLTSDARLKRDIAPVPGGCLDRVAAVQPKTFRFIEPDGAAGGGSPGFFERRHWGFTAQEMREAIPDAVEEDEAGNLSISQGDLIACLWKAVAELSAKVAVLEGRI